MKKPVKLCLKIVLWLFVLIVLALVTTPLWLGPVVKTVAAKVAPKVAQITVTMDHLSINPFTARVELRGLKVGNPEGYDVEHAATLGDVVFDAETLSLLSDVIHIEEVKVTDVFASYVTGGPNTVNNFEQIQYNVAGGKEKYEAAKAEAAAAEEQSQSAEQPTDDKPQKRLIIDRLEIAGLKVQMGVLPINLPLGLTMTDIGKNSGGATLMQVGEEVWNEIMKAASAVISETTKVLGESAKMLGDGVKNVGEDTKKVVDSLKNLWKTK